MTTLNASQLGSLLARSAVKAEKMGKATRATARGPSGPPLQSAPMATPTDPPADSASNGAPLKLAGDADAAETDAQLLEAHRNGREDAFETLVRRYRPELLPYLIRFVRGRAAAEDVFQETFLQIHLSADSFDVSKRFKPWLYTIASNKARDLLRKKKRRHTVPLSAGVGRDGDGPAFVDLMDSGLPRPADLAADRDIAERVRETVEDLPDHLREVLLLAYFEHFAYREIAEMLSIPLGTVKSRLHAAVGTFAQKWKVRRDRGDGVDDGRDGPPRPDDG